MTSRGSDAFVIKLVHFSTKRGPEPWTGYTTPLSRTCTHAEVIDNTSHPSVSGVKKMLQSNVSNITFEYSDYHILESSDRQAETSDTDIRNDPAGYY